MATRFYFPASGSAPVTPPSPDAAWTVSTGFTTHPLKSAYSNTAKASGTARQKGSTTANTNRLDRQYLSEFQVAAGAISGTFSMVMRGVESATGADDWLQVIIKVVSADGTTVRGTLYSGSTATAESATAGNEAQEFGTSLSTRIKNGISLSSVTAQDGDRILVEVGYRSNGTTSTHTGTLEYGDPTGSSDYALTAGLTTALVPWIEFSQNLTAYVPPDSPTLVASYTDQETASNLTALTTSAFTPADGELIVVKASGSDNVLSWNNAPTGGSLTFAPVSDFAGASQCPAKIWAVKIGTSPGSMSVSLTPTGSGVPHSFVVERWSNAKLDATPAVNATENGTGAPSTTLTTEAANSRVSWVCADWNANAPGTPAYRSSATQEYVADVSTSFYVGYYAYQQAATAGSQTIGMTAPTGQKWTMLGVEIQYEAPPAASPQAMRFDANERAQSTVSLGTQSDYTVSCWGRIVTDRNDYSTFLALDNGSSNSLHLATGSDGTTINVWDDNGGGQKTSGPALTVGTWYFLALAVSGTTGTLYYRALGDSSLSSVAMTGLGSRNIGRIDIGSNFNAEFLNGNVAAVKLWLAQLSSAELLEESNYYDAQRTTNLSRAWRLNGSLAEETGNGTALTGGSGAYENGPTGIPLAPSTLGEIVPGTPTVVENQLSSITPDMSTCVVGDCALLTVAADATISTPTGWTPCFTQINQVVDFAAFYRFLDGGANDDPTVTATGATRLTAIVQPFAGVDTTTPLDVTPVTNNGAAAASINLSGVTTVTDGALAVSGAAIDASAATQAFTLSWTGGTEVMQTTGTGRRQEVAQKPMPTAGATGTATWTQGGGTTLWMVGFQLALRPAPAEEEPVDLTKFFLSAVA